MTRGDSVTDKDDGLEGQANIAGTKLSAKARGPVGIVALLLGLNIVAIVGTAYLTTITDGGALGACAAENFAGTIFPDTVYILQITGKTIPFSAYY